MIIFHLKVFQKINQGLIISKLQFSFFLQFFLNLRSCWLKSSINCLHFREFLNKYLKFRFSEFGLYIIRFYIKNDSRNHVQNSNFRNYVTLRNCNTTKLYFYADPEIKRRKRSTQNRLKMA